MSGYVNDERPNALFFQMKHSPRMLAGVCAHFADRCGLPVWLVRVVAVFLLLMHPPLLAALYVGAALWLRSHRCEVAAPAWDRDGLCTRFSRLDRRLAEMERAALDREAGLRRAFRDLN